MQKKSRVSYSQPVLYSIAQLAANFELDRRTVSKRLQQCKASGENRGHPVYKLKDAAPFLVDWDNRRLPEDEEEDQFTDPDKMPPEMQKDYWDAQLKKQKYEKEAGHLWDTLEVMSTLAEVFKTLAPVLRTLPDVLERECNLDPDQVDVAQDIIFSQQEEMYEQLIARFGGSEDADQPE